MNTITHSASAALKLVVGLVAASLMVLLPATARGEATPVAAPAIPGVAALPGPIVNPGKAGANMKTLKTTPDIALPGAGMTISGSGLAANAEVTLTWSTATVDWVLDPRPDSVDYLGRKANKLTVALATAR